MAKVEYKFKPYKPVNLKKADTTKDKAALKKSLETQRNNLNERLLAEGIDPDNLSGEFDNRNIIEKALNLTPDQGLLLDFFEVINRPVEAVKAGIMAGHNGEDVMNAAWEGLSGEVLTPGSEVASEILDFQPETNVGKFLTDVGVDILLDPLTYVPAGILFKGLKKYTRRTVNSIIKKSDDLYSASLNNLLKKVPLEAGESLDNYIKRISDLKTDDVLKLGKDADFVEAEYLAGGNRRAALDYSFSITGLKNRADMLDKLYSQGFEIRKVGDKNVKYVKGTNLLYKDAVAAELAYYKKIKNLLEVDGSDIKVVLTSTDNTRPDVVILKRVKGTDNYLQIGTVEVKKMGDSMLTSSTLVFENGTFKFAAGGFDFGPEISTKLDNFLNMELSDGRLIKEHLTDVYTTGRGIDKPRSVEIQQLVSQSSDEVKDAYKALMFDMAEAKGVKEFAFTAPSGESILLTLDEARKYTKLKDITGFSTTGSTVATKRNVVDFITNLKSKSRITTRGMDDKQLEIYNYLVDFYGDKAKANKAIKNLTDAELDDYAGQIASSMKSQFRMRPTMVIDDEALELIKADGVGLNIDETAQRFIGTESISRQVGILETISENAAGTKVGALAKAADNFIKRFSNLFSIKGALGADTYDKMKRILGETMFDLERRSARLAQLKKELIAVDSKAGEYLAELIEAGAYLDEAGNIRRMNRRVGMSDLFDYSVKRTEDGAEIVLPQFADQAAKTNFKSKINQMYEEFATGIPDFFDVVERNGGTVLRYNGDLRELNDFIKWYNEKKLAGRFRNDYAIFGEKKLSTGALNLLRKGSPQVKEYQKISDDILRQLVEQAGFENLPRALSGQIGYMRHIITKEAYEGLARRFPKVKSIFAKGGADTLAQRTFLGSADEINAAMREFMELDIDIFDPNAFNAMEDLIKISQRKLEQRQILDLVLNNRGRDGQKLLRIERNIKDVKLGADDIAFKSFREEFGTLYDNLSPDGKKAMDNFLKTEGLSDSTMIVMNRSAHNVLKNVQKAYIDLNPFLKGYDKFLNTWKGLTLITPGFHMRNMFGNMFNSYAAGMTVLEQNKYLGRSMMELAEFQKIGKKLAQGLELTASEKELFKIVKGYFENGVSQTHRGIRDLEQIKEGVEAATKGGKARAAYDNLIRFNFNVAEKMDDVQRYALYRWSLDKTGDASKAARTVSEALFDYSHLTPFEKDYMKRIFPFYTFMKNNFIFQAKAFMKNPGKYARTGRAYNYYLEDIAGYGPDELPDYATENMWIPIPMTVTKNDKQAIAFLKANLPLADFTELVENPFKKGVISLTAPVKLLIEFGAGRDLFTGAPLQAFPGETNAMQEGEGVLSNLRDKRGNLTITQSPLFQKILNDIGLRTPINMASAGLDVVDSLMGYQGTPEGLGDLAARAGLVGIQEVENLELTQLYQDLERLRELKQYYEQETGNQLPVLPRG
jgi:hypothetical protein